MTVRPARLNAAIAWLFMVGSACFVLGSVQAYAEAVGGLGRRRHLLRRARSSSPRPRPASWCRRRAPRRPASTTVGQHVPRTGAAARLAARTTATGSPPRPSSPAPSSSTSARFAALTPQRHRGARPTATSGGPTCSGRCCSSSPAPTASSPCRAGSSRWDAGVAAVADRVDQHARLGAVHGLRPGELRAARRPTRCSTPGSSVAGTLLGAVCFLVGAALMLPAWRRDLRPRRRHPPPRPRRPGPLPKEKRMTSYVPSDADAALFGNRFATAEVPSTTFPHDGDVADRRDAARRRGHRARGRPRAQPGHLRHHLDGAAGAADHRRRTCTATSSTTPSTRARRRSSSAASGCSPTCSTRRGRPPAPAPRARPRRSCSARCR